jgi:hypothetical protein
VLNSPVAEAFVSHLQSAEAVAQRSRRSTPTLDGGSGVGDGCGVSAGVTTVGAVSGPYGGDLVPV